MIHAMCSGKRWQQAVDHFDQLPSADVVSYNTTMMALSESQEWQKALELFQQLKRHGPLPTTNSFNIAMDVWSQHDPSVDCAKQVDQLQAEMHRSSVPLAQDTYRIMIQAQAAGGHWPKVLALLQEAGRLEPVERDTSICGLGVLSKIPEAKDIMLQLARQAELLRKKTKGSLRNAGQRPQALPGVSRQRREELDIESFGGMPKDLGEELYRPRLRPCACGCGQMVLGEWTCDGEIAPLRSSDVHAAVARSAPQMSLAEQQASVARLTRRKTPTTSPSAQEKTPSPSPKRRIDRQRLELIALPRELPPPPKPPEPIKARPAPARPQAVATSASEPVLHPGAAAFLAPPRRKVVKLTPQRSMLPGLGSLLFKASLVRSISMRDEKQCTLTTYGTGMECLIRLVSTRIRRWDSPVERMRLMTGCSSGTQSSLPLGESHVVPAATAHGRRNVDHSDEKLQDVEFYAEWTSHLLSAIAIVSRIGTDGRTLIHKTVSWDYVAAAWYHDTGVDKWYHIITGRFCATHHPGSALSATSLRAHMQDWLNRLQVLLDNAVDGEHKAWFPKKDSPSNKTNGQSINDLAVARYKETGSIDQFLQESDQKLFDLLEDWLSRFQLFFLDGQAETPHHAEAESACGSKQLRNKDGDFPSESGRKESNLQSFHGLKALHNSSTGSSMNLVNMYSLDEEETKEVSCRQMCMDMDWPMRSGDPVPPLPFAWQRYLYPYVFSWMFEAFFGFVIISNSIFLGIQVELTASHPGAPPSEAMFVIASIYTLLFTVELLLRLLVGGVRTCTQDWAWLALDILVVASSLMEFILEIILRGEEQSATQNVSTSMRMVRILRVAKITRAIRVVRLVKFIRSLKTLLYCIGRTLRAMAWSGVLLIMIIFLFSLIFTDICTEWRVDEVNATEDPATWKIVTERFGTLGLSWHTLPLSGGLTWIEVSDALARISPLWQMLFEVYIAFCLFAVLGPTIGPFCQSAIESAERDHELILQNVAHEKAKYFRAVRRLFNQLDRNGDGGVSIKEFKQAMKDPSLHAIFDALEISAGDAWALFTQLDRDGDAEVNVDEFLEGCMLLKGPARSIDVIGIKRDLMRLQDRMDTYVNDVSDVKRIVSRPLKISTRSMEQKLKGLSIAFDAGFESASPAVSVPALSSESTLEGTRASKETLEGAELTAKALPNRLATGAVVEEEKIVGVRGYDRLSYRKLLGAGPELGWVSLQANGVPLLQLLPPAPDLPRARTLRRRGEDEAPGSPAWVEETRYREIASIRFILDAPCEEVAVALSAALHGAPGRIDMQREIFAAGQLQLRDPPEQEQTGLPLPVPMSPQWRETAFATTDFSEETVWNGSVGNSSASFSLGLRPLWSDELCTYQEEASELEVVVRASRPGRSPAFEFSCPRRIRSVIRVTEETCEHPQKLFHLQVLCSRIKEAIKLSFDETQREALGLAYDLDSIHCSCGVRPTSDGRAEVFRQLFGGSALAETQPGPRPTGRPDFDYDPIALLASQVLYMLDIETRVWASIHGFPLVELWRGLRRPFQWATFSALSSAASHLFALGSAADAAKELRQGDIFDMRVAKELEQLVPHCKNEIGKKQGQFTEGSVDVVSFAELLQRICRRADPQADIYRSFADLGSGRGHAVLAAHALFPFRHCVGYEIDKEAMAAAYKEWIGHGCQKLHEPFEAPGSLGLFASNQLQSLDLGLGRLRQRRHLALGTSGRDWSIGLKAEERCSLGPSGPTLASGRLGAPATL
ncbi:unnamed protein product [Durusdinium trenchii]